MKLLLVRLSSLGDVLHTLPALSDLRRRRPEVAVHWLVEPAYASIAARHPAVAEALPFGLRGFKGRPGAVLGALRALRTRLRGEDYDLVLDAQGLFKSAFLARLAGVRVAGLDGASAREGAASLLYGKRLQVSWGPQAIVRSRSLFAQALDYETEGLPLDYGLGAWRRSLRESGQPEALEGLAGEDFVLGFHGSAWPHKCWPVARWVALARLLAERRMDLLLPWGSEAEREEAESVRAASPGNVAVLPKLDLPGIAALMARAQAYVGVDTGLSHLAAALDLPGVSLYGPTDAEQTGVLGEGQIRLRSPLSCSPCLKRQGCPLATDGEGLVPCQGAMTADMVWQRLAEVLP